jgi:hypothetical protein
VSRSRSTTYERAKAALAQCASIDECQKWANKAEALASYAKQAHDTPYGRWPTASRPEPSVGVESY